MSAHTKGPWHTGQGNGEGSIFADEGRMRFENGTVLYPICTMNTGWDKTEDAANARLVAAAPELLEALKALAATARTFRNVPKHEQEWTPLDEEALEAAFAAIAKAEGMQ